MAVTDTPFQGGMQSRFNDHATDPHVGGAGYVRHLFWVYLWLWLMVDTSVCHQVKSVGGVCTQKKLH